MNSRQRVLTTLNHQEPDMVPLDIGATNSTGIHIQAYQNLCRHLGLPIKNFDIINVSGQRARIDDLVADTLGVDVSGVYPKPSSMFNLAMQEDQEYYYYYDEWQVGRKMPKDGGFYFDVFDHPLHDAENISDIDSFPWPDPTDPSRFIGLSERVHYITQEKKRACTVIGLTVGATETAFTLRGFENFYLDMASNKKFAAYLIEKITALKMAYWEKALAEIGDQIDIVLEGDDLGSQDRMLMSPKFYREIIKPAHKKLFSFIHQHTSAKLFFHSCGAIRPIIPDLIDIGVEILNPIQVSAKDMDTNELKREFGKDLSFWGGGIDTQFVLGSGTPVEIETEVVKRMNDLAPGGGFVFATVHCIQANVPPENIETMLTTFRNHRTY